MREPIFVRPLEEDERKALEEGLRSKDAFVLRRCQILLASARGERAPRIARAALGCNPQRPCATPSTPSTKGASGGRSARAPPAPAPSTPPSTPSEPSACGSCCTAEPPRLRQAHQPVDPGVGRRGRLRGGAHRETGDGRDRSGHPGEAGGALAAGQAVDHQPRPRVREKKRRRDRLMRLAEESPGWGWWASRTRLLGGAAWPCPRCTPGARKASRRAWSNARSPRTTPSREGRLLLRAVGAGVRADVA